MSLARFRWLLWRSGLPSYRGVEELVDIPCRRALQALRGATLPHLAYVSKHGKHEAWLTVFSDTSNAVPLERLVESALDHYAHRAEHIADETHEVLLSEACAVSREDLATWTAIALQLHKRATLAATQRRLIAIGKQGRSNRVLLHPLLSELSTAYSTLPDLDGLWSRASCSCLPHTDAIHWLYNIVLGFDWEWHLSESEIAARLGLRWS